MALVLTSGPLVEPVALLEAKAHLRVDHNDEDTLISSLIITSRLHIEASLGLGLITQSWSLFLDDWPPGTTVRLPMRPVQSVSAVRLYNENETTQTVAASGYYVDGKGTPARLVRLGGVGWPGPERKANGIEIAFTAGYGAAASDVPQPIRQALLLLIAHWYERREPFEQGGSAVAIPKMVSELLMPYRERRL